MIPFIPVQGLQENILNGILNAMPEEVSGYMSTFFSDLLLHKKTSILSIGFLLTLFFASNTMTAILKGFSNSYHLHRIKRKKISIRLWSIALMFIFSFLVIVATLVFTLGGMIIDYLKETDFIRSSIDIWLVWIIEWILIFLLFILAISILYNVGNTDKAKWKLFSPGAIFSTLMIWLFSQLFSVYLNYFAPFNKLYGSLGTIIIFLLFIYYFFAILLIGFELNLSIQSGSRKKTNQS
jgi:membrane protein